MHVGTLEVTLFIPNAESLKDKRHVVKSLVETTRRKFNISIAEIEHLDKWQLAKLGIACVSNDVRFLNTVLDKVIDLLESSPEFELGEVEMNID